jgi:hypothetical protein
VRSRSGAPRRQSQSENTETASCRSKPT